MVCDGRPKPARTCADVASRARSVFSENGSAACAVAGPLVTQIGPFDAFIMADAHHQGYYRAHQGSAYCQIVIEPKVAKARKAFVSRLKAHA